MCAPPSGEAAGSRGWCERWIREHRLGQGVSLGKGAAWQTEKGPMRRANFFTACWNTTGDPALRWEVARVWRLGRRFSYGFVSAQLKLRPARQLKHWALIGGKQICPRRLCSSRQHQVLLMKSDS
jgi:hypothetical protein